MSESRRGRGVQAAKPSSRGRKLRKSLSTRSLSSQRTPCTPPSGKRSGLPTPKNSSVRQDAAAPSSKLRRSQSSGKIVYKHKVDSPLPSTPGSGSDKGTVTRLRRSQSAQFTLPSKSRLRYGSSSATAASATRNGKGTRKSRSSSSATPPPRSATSKSRPTVPTFSRSAEKSGSSRMRRARSSTDRASPGMHKPPLGRTNGRSSVGNPVSSASSESRSPTASFPRSSTLPGAVTINITQGPKGRRGTVLFPSQQRTLFTATSSTESLLDEELTAELESLGTSAPGITPSPSASSSSSSSKNKQPTPGVPGSPLSPVSPNFPSVLDDEHDDLSPLVGTSPAVAQSTSRKRPAVHQRGKSHSAISSCHNGIGKNPPGLTQAVVPPKTKQQNGGKNGTFLSVSSRRHHRKASSLSDPDWLVDDDDGGLMLTSPMEPDSELKRKQRVSDDPDFELDANLQSLHRAMGDEVFLLHDNVDELLDAHEKDQLQSALSADWNT